MTSSHASGETGVARGQTDFMRWGIARGKGTIVGTCDDNTEVRVRWDEDRREGRNVKCG